MSFLIGKFDCLYNYVNQPAQVDLNTGAIFGYLPTSSLKLLPIFSEDANTLYHDVARFGVWRYDFNVFGNGAQMAIQILDANINLLFQVTNVTSYVNSVYISSLLQPIHMQIFLITSIGTDLLNGTVGIQKIISTYK